MRTPLYHPWIHWLDDAVNIVLAVAAALGLLLIVFA
jgi:hypothetical protein